MHLFGTLELEIQPGTPDNPASVRVALLRYARGEDGRLFITPDCTSFEEVEGQADAAVPAKEWAQVKQPYIIDITS
jgi:hypothetical protein